MSRLITETEQIRDQLMPILPEGFAMGLAEPKCLDSISLHPFEAACLGSKATARRRKEFLLGRAAAHMALRAMGRTEPIVLKGKFGEPVWPYGTIGSITHKDDMALAVVAPANRCRAVGIDLESIDDPILAEISRRICHPEEIPWVYEDSAAICLRLKLVFSAKESIFKALNPLWGEFFSFTDIRLRWCDAKETFDVSLPQKLCHAFSNSVASPVHCRATGHFVVALFVLW